MASNIKKPPVKQPGKRPGGPPDVKSLEGKWGFHAVAESSPDAFFILKSERGGEGHIIDLIFAEADSHAGKLFREPGGRLPGKRISGVYPFKVESGLFEKFAAAVETGEAQEAEYAIPQPDGSTLWYACRAVRFGDGVVANVRDITHHKRTGEELDLALEGSRRRHAEMAALLEGSRAVLKYREFEDAARAIFDYCKDLIGATAGYVALLTEDGMENEVLFLESGGRPCTVDPGLPMPIRGLRAEAYRTGMAIYDNDFNNSEWMKFMPEGHVMLDNILFAPLVVDGKPVGLIGLSNKEGGFTDDDARMASAFGELASVALMNSRALETLEEREEQFRTVVDASKDAMIAIDREGLITTFNAAAEKMFGYRKEEMIGRTLAPLIPERYREKHGRDVESYFATGKPDNAIGETMELPAMRADGTLFPIELSLSVGLRGNERFVLGVIRDITERKQAEEALERQAKELARSNAELEMFAYVTSHDLQEPLRTVTSYLQLLEKRYKGRLDSDAREFIDFAVDGAGRMHEMVRGLLEYSRVGKADRGPSPTDCEAALETALANLTLSVEESGAEVTHDPLPTVLAESAQLARLFQNLIGNAIKFRGEEPPRIHISARQEDGNWVFSVRDNGIGIEPKYADVIFTIFQRLHTREEYPGTGIGLAMCKKIVEHHGGRIWVESRPGEGATFYFTMPVLGAEQQQPGPA